MTSTGSKKRDAEIQRYRTYIWASGLQHPTFDQERYYTEMSTRDVIALRDKTVQGLLKYPDFGTKFYGEFVEYLDSKLAQRRTLRDWLWRNTVLRLDLALWKWKYERANY